ncbi:DUF1236 domain-containing protein [Methylorubrum salsuginis]|uniref:DUF1236 domain-containing protein n=1 Tax=Methylorubrum salsuginis TaxID=414703 RepID=A0A1I4K580_9HYPH|nr:DUF1236 domain-containing protein [Methylorubrum salsuginis]SFL73962.1 Protein of unknown function [Methylorubrum salsuginis]
MTNKFWLATVTASLLALPAAAQAQGTIRGAAEGAEAGAAAAGPVGGVVGGAVGAATGTVGGILGVDDRPRFRSYVRERNVRSYDYDGRVAVGSTLPASGVTYYDVPSEYRVKPGYRYTVVNRQPVLVDGSHRIVEVLD